MVMTESEAYKLGYQVGTEARVGKRRRIASASISLPLNIRPRTPQAMTYRLGYHDGLFGRPMPVKP